ncbi:cAMP-binding domain of CRP or a regulatory subunit of cAMP-dependent protein kinases [Chitinophaga sp. CF118]|uniref:Crp/Fnr family transcriptional regulator n=1 Tax=Chitinophaga sp. CF118 TaxID=1884367 RepID=UPI0008DF4880|nr:Crp/Fnr family transcriptional regulator [Chitinophaga sp. CF118]SFD14004.1 cAMP-binding domain of CRP or a regulatory subunit of cAMP-dependent protein kinases [Chitinophaga sp. CF118]
MTEIKLLEQALHSFTGMDEKEFALSIPFWQVKQYKKGEYYNEYKNVCKHLGFIINGIFRTYYLNEETGEEKNILFYTDNQIVAAYKSFINQTPCNYYTECMVDSTIIYIHINHLQELYQQSHQWERFGRYVVEMGFNLIMNRTEDILFKTPEQRYVELLKLHPNIFNTVPLYHIASYLGIQGPSLSRIRKRMLSKG